MQADLYEVRIWNTEGTVIYSKETKDTSIVLPEIIRPGMRYLWDVKARTGWDRWVSSDLVELSLRDARLR
jgi:hypothetical protein